VSGIPVEVFDEENHSVWSSDLWELVTPRAEGDYVGKRTIGSANIVSAYNLLHLKLLADNNTSDSLQVFKHSLEELQAHNLVRRRPERVREGFRAV
jgi:hypothetical protein